MSKLSRNIIYSMFDTLKPGQTLKIGNYVAKPENSVWIPIEYLDMVRKFCKHNGVSFTAKFRGPRFDRTRAFTKKADAYFFSIYYMS